MTLKSFKKGISALNIVSGKEIRIENSIIQILQFIYMDVNFDWIVESHSHSWYELHYVNSGQAYTILDGKELIVNPGYYYIIPPDTEHKHNQSVLNKGHKGFALRWQLIPFSQNNIDKKNIHLKELEQGFSDKKIREGQRLIESISYLIKRSLDFNSSKLEILTNLAAFLFSLSINKDVYSWNQVSDLACSLSYQAKLFLEDNYHKQLKMDEVAETLGVSYPYLARVFKKDMKQTMVSYLQTIRIQEIKKLLGNKKMTLKEIAEQVGFDNQYYLSKVFKDYIGISPSQYRNQITDM